MLSSLTLQMPINVAISATVMATSVFNSFLDFCAAATFVVSSVPSSSLSNCIGSGSTRASSPPKSDYRDQIEGNHLSTHLPSLYSIGLGGSLINNDSILT